MSRFVLLSSYWSAKQHWKLGHQFSFIRNRVRFSLSHSLYLSLSLSLSTVSFSLHFLPWYAATSVNIILKRKPFLSVYKWLDSWRICYCNNNSKLLSNVFCCLETNPFFALIRKCCTVVRQLWSVAYLDKKKFQNGSEFNGFNSRNLANMLKFFGYTEK